MGSPHCVDLLRPALPPGRLREPRKHPLAVELEELVLPRPDRAVAVADSGREVHGLRPEAGDDDLWRLVGQVVDPAVLEAVMAAAVVMGAALPEGPDHLYRLLEHLESFVGSRPAVSKDVL